MKKIFIFLFISSLFYSQNKTDSTIVINRNISILKNNIKNLTDKYDYQVKVNDQALNGISTQLDAASFNISIFSFLFGIIAIILGVYITWVERKIVKLRDENQNLLNETKKTKIEVVEINELIQKDIYGLFLKIKREETIHILNRLVNIPENINNVSSELLSRELIPDDFSLLKSAYQKLPDEEPIKTGFISIRGTYKDSYLLLFFQHFLEQTIKDVDLRFDIRNFFDTGIRCAFKNDIVKSAKDFTKSINDLGYEDLKADIIRFFDALSESKFKDFIPLYETIFNNLKNKDFQFEIITLIDSNKGKIAKIKLGRLYIDKYKNEKLIEREKELIADLKILEKEDTVVE